MVNAIFVFLVFGLVGVIILWLLMEIKILQQENALLWQELNQDIDGVEQPGETQNRDGITIIGRTDEGREL